MLSTLNRKKNLKTLGNACVNETKRSQWEQVKTTDSLVQRVYLSLRQSGNWHYNYQKELTCGEIILDQIGLLLRLTTDTHFP